MCQSELTEFLAELTEFAAELSKFCLPNSTLKTAFRPFPIKLTLLENASIECSKPSLKFVKEFLRFSLSRPGH